MKKINSINYGGKVIGIGLLFMLIIPGILMLLNSFIEFRYLTTITTVFFTIGIIILVGFSVLLFIEFRQDKRLDKYYSQHKNVKIKLLNGKYECGACGNRQISENSSSCDVCGCRYEE